MSSLSNNIQGKKGCQFSQSLRGVNLEQVLVVAIDATKFLPKADTIRKDLAFANSIRTPAEALVILM
jgi:hypothetical protein